MGHARRLAVVGAGWAGLAAAIEACDAGHAVTLVDMAHRAGGRARSLPHGEVLLDNGAHILIGAYQQTLALMRQIGLDPDALLLRRPLSLLDPQGRGLRLPAGPALPAFAWGVLRWKDVPLADRVALLRTALRWQWQGFRCAPGTTVQTLAAGLPETVIKQLIEPLSVAALNTPAREASAQVLLTVLRDALFSAPGAADLLLPRRPLSQLLPDPALHWLKARGAQWRPGHRAQTLERAGTGWRLDGECFDRVILACPPAEAARLVQAHAAAWATQAASFRYEPIVTVWIRAPGLVWPQPMLRLDGQAAGFGVQPAQFGFDLGQLDGPAGLFALVISGAADWVDQGLPATTEAVLRQWRRHFGSGEVWTARVEKRATFACLPDLVRPGARIATGLWAAGDHVAGPYPATIEAAVRAGRAAAQGALADGDL